MATLTRFCPDPWLTDPCDCEPFNGLTTEKQVVVNEMAAHMLWKATGSRFGPCPVIVRPCRDPAACCGRCGDPCAECGCDRVYEITLPGPIHEITEVLVDGIAVPAADYRVDDYYWLVNLVGPWPQCQNLSAAADALGAFAVSYNVGLPPPSGAGLVQAELASELAKAICGDSDCALPRRMASKTRQGVQVTFDDLDDGKTGILFVDLWVANVNQRSRPGRVFSPDLPKPPRITTWPVAP